MGQIFSQGIRGENIFFIGLVIQKHKHECIQGHKHEYNFGQLVVLGIELETPKYLQVQTVLYLW